MRAFRLAEARARLLATVFLAVFLAVLAAGCTDFLAAPAHGPAHLSISYALGGGTASGAAAAFEQVDELHVSLARGTVPVVDSSFAVSGGDAVLRQAIRVEMEEPEEEMELTVELRWQGSPRFAGSTTVRLVRGARNAAELTLQPLLEPGRIYGRVRDLQTLAPVAGASVTLVRAGSTSPQVVPVGADGGYSLAELQPGEYTVRAAADGYEANTADVRVAEGDVAQIGFDLPTLSSEQQVTGVAGRVVDDQGAPIGGATVMISGGALTNGVFKSVVTAADGTYTLTGVSLTVGGEPIPAFTVLAAANGRETRRRDALALVSARTPANVDFTLLPGGTAQVFFADGFETGVAWQADGFWNRTTGAGIVNTAVPSQARLAPDDTTAAALPRAAEGSRYLWYGDPAAGNFLGTGENGGTATSPAFTIPAGTPLASLSFRTWFEIESVNPATFDSMTVSIVDVAAGTAERVALLNPASDPNLSERDSIPFTSGGFNRAPIFRPVSLDVTRFAGRQIRIALRFHTLDGQYNYFRGWIVDDVRVTNQAPAATAASLQVQRAPFTAPAPCGARCARRR